MDLLFGYTGKQLDEATGLQHNLFRWYDSNIGQWLSEDPLSFAAGDENIKRYVGNGSINRLDPDGLDWLDSLANFGAGWGDALTFGYLDDVRGGLGINDGIDQSSTAYGVGIVVGVTNGVAIVGAIAIAPAATTVAAPGTIAIGSGDNSLVGWVIGEEIASISTPLVTHSALGIECGAIVDGAVIEGAHAFTAINVSGVIEVGGSINFGGFLGVPSYVIEIVKSVVVPLQSSSGEQSAMYIKIKGGDPYLQWIYHIDETDVIIIFAKTETSWGITLQFMLPRKAGGPAGPSRSLLRRLALFKAIKNDTSR